MDPLADPLPDIYDQCLEVVAAIEPDIGIFKDPALARPVEYLPNTLYVYPQDEDHVGYESGPGVRQNFRLLVDLALDDRGEQAAAIRDPVVTDLLRQRARSYAQWVRVHQAGTYYQHLRVASIDWQALNGLGYRGFRMRLDGYRLVG